MISYELILKYAQKCTQKLLQCRVTYEVFLVAVSLGSQYQEWLVAVCGNTI
jgi:hypothetical protein